MPRVPILLLTAIGALLRFYAIGRQGFWYDESYTVYLVHHSPGTMLGLIPSTESTPPLYYCVAWVWARIFGFGPAGLKSLSALCGTLTIPVAYATARKMLGNRRSALIVGALTAFNPLLIWYSQEARAYEMLVLFSALTLLMFAYARERPRPPAVALWGLACALALLTHYYAAIVIVPEAAWLLYEHRHSRAVRLALGGLVLVTLALAPLALKQSGNVSNHWIAHASYLRRLRQIPALFLIGPETHLRTVLKFLAFAMVAVAVGLLIWRTRRRERQGALLPGGLALAGFLIAAIPGYSTFLGRNVLPLWLPAALLLAGGLGAARARLAGIGATATLCAIGVVGVVSVDTTHAFQRPNWQLVADTIGRWPPRHTAGADARIVVVQDNPGGMPLSLYLANLRYLKASSVARVSEIDIIAALPHKGLGGFCWWGSECNLVPSRLDRNYHIPGFQITLRTRVRDFGILILRARHPTTVTTAALPAAVADERLRRRRPNHDPAHDGQFVQQFPA